MINIVRTPSLHSKELLQVRGRVGVLTQKEHPAPTGATYPSPCFTTPHDDWILEPIPDLFLFSGIYSAMIRCRTRLKCRNVRLAQIADNNKISDFIEPYHFKITKPNLSFYRLFSTELKLHIRIAFKG